jgi:hypothetical protein
VAVSRTDPLGWQAFSAAYFPDRRRHDFEALIAYGAYRRSGGVDEPASAIADIAGNGARDRAAVESWEDEGGQPV